MSNWQLLFACMGIVMWVYLLKHIFLSIIAFIFPVAKQIKLYSFTINIFNIITGLALIPTNLLIGFGPESSVGVFVWLSFLIIGLLYVYRQLRGLAIGNRFLSFYQIHFCCIFAPPKIVPLVIIYKIIKDQVLFG